MNKKLKSMAVALLIFTSGLSITTDAHGDEYLDYVEPTRIRCTVYCDYGVTKSGCMTREGIAAMNNEMLGKTAILYDQDMNYIGIYEILDTGGHQRLKTGSAIDIYRPTKEACEEWIKTYGDYVYIQIIDAEG